MVTKDMNGFRVLGSTVGWAASDIPRQYDKQEKGEVDGDCGDAEDALDNPIDCSSEATRIGTSGMSSDAENAP
jgi:hypothetical protein